MNKTNILFLYLITVTLLVGCDDCNDCKDLQQKSVLVQDANGTNLLFGDSAIFNPEEATLLTEGDTPQALFIDEDTQTLQFSLEDNETTYFLHLDANNNDTLVFELSERESERCCGNQTFSTSTQLNGTMVENSDTITIVK